MENFLSISDFKSISKNRIECSIVKRPIIICISHRFENSLVHLPAGVLYEIFKHLDWMDLCRLAQTCTKFQELVQKATIW